MNQDRYKSRIIKHDMSGLSVVVPAHNEVENLPTVIARIKSTLEKLFDAAPWNYEIIIVNDGSTDGTRELLEEFALNKIVRPVHHETNKGYGAALKSGFDAARFEFVSFIDGDNQLYPEDLLSLAPDARIDSISMGYRVKRDDPWYRVLLGKTFSQVFVPLMIGIRVRDVDCALKIIPRGFLREANLKADGALINAEMLAIAKIEGYHFHQHPVRHSCREFGEQSGGNLLVIGRVFKELLSIRRKLSLLKVEVARKTQGARSIVAG